MVIYSRRLSATTFKLFCFLTIALLVACRQPVTWTPKPPYGATTGTKDFDLTANGTDTNGSPLNPRWAPQPKNLPPLDGSTCQKKAQPYVGDCTDQTKFLRKDIGKGLNGLLCSAFGDGSAIPGHADWTVATAGGPVGWLNFADDFDYNLLLLPDQDFGLTDNNNREPNNGPRYMEVEFDSREFNFGTKWWRELAKRAEDGAQTDDWTAIQGWIGEGQDLPYGVIYGIFGIDCEHGCRSEIHPAYAVAIQVSDAKDGNKWAIFARNWGDEGFCSSLNHRLDLSGVQNALHIMLPYSATAGPTIKGDDYEVAARGHGASQCPSFNFVTGQGEEVTIPLPPPDQEGLTEIFVDFQWPDGASSVKYQQVGKQAVMNMLAARASERGKSVEDHLGRLRKEFKKGEKSPRLGFTEGLLKPFVANLPAGKQQSAIAKQGVSAGCPVPEATSPPPPLPGGAAQAKPKLAKLPTYANKDLWDRAALKDFCDAYNKSGRQLPDGEPADVRAKLDKVCGDKKLRP